ncbi:Uncharacterised protein [Enterobacter hormaechei]|uniref:hypothetical protein n=1 Tax=Enterobacter hormaechei TaxID=158836 RepID=UPI00079BCFEB|nr:hypothetical protein [Enterobacter hormaechei]WMA51391.1 hypothetical protein QPR81_14720 [Enterobacter hormaechei]CZU66592.1 Uncharacterised protein [Enterobacter hormaechei]CZV79071.1 Uncharacterised protein [Enterobacter hormaechei]CZV96865.1 Uncharacterised protein [Enterobacter hormaechei]CZW30833.1 Uncharacterised protein [Enterobacter hormaechei]
MKTPLDMLHDIVAQISEGNTLLEMIYKNTEEMNEETDCGLACLIRSFDKTRETAYAYIEELANNAKTVTPPSGIEMILPMIFFMPQSALQNSGNWLTYITNHIFQEKTVMTLIA